VDQNRLLDAARYLRTIIFLDRNDTYWAYTQNTEAGRSWVPRLPNNSLLITRAGAYCIYLGEEFSRILHPLAHYSGEERLRVVFKLQRTLLHEVAHAV
jgi:hypothetical protein